MLWIRNINHIHLFLVCSVLNQWYLIVCRMIFSLLYFIYQPQKQESFLTWTLHVSSLSWRFSITPSLRSTLSSCSWAFTCHNNTGAKCMRSPFSAVSVWQPIIQFEAALLHLECNSRKPLLCFISANWRGINLRWTFMLRWSMLPVLLLTQRRDDSFGLGCLSLCRVY